MIDELPTRIASKIEVDPFTGCWHWTASLNYKGYSQVWWQGRMRSGHRLIYQMLIGPISDGLQIDHLCRVPACVNPDHLEPVTPTENSRRGRHGVLLTHCPQGHPYDEDNTKHHPNGRWRDCKECINRRSREWKRRNRMATR